MTSTTSSTTPVPGFDVEHLERMILRGRLATALKAAEDHLGTALGVGDRHGEALAHSVIAFAAHYQGRATDGLLAAYRAIELLDQGPRERLPLEDARRLAAVLSRAAVDAARLSDPEEALRLIADAQHIIIDHGDDQLSFRVLNNMAIVHSEIGRFQEAAEIMRSAHDVAVRMGNPYEIAHATGNMLCYRFEQISGQLREAAPRAGDELASVMGDFRAFEENCRSLGWGYLVTDVLLHAATALVVDGQYDVAREMLSSGEVMTRAHQMEGEHCAFLHQLARLNRLTGQHREAHRQLDEMLESAATVQDERHQVRYHEEASLLLADEGQFEEALHHHRRFHELTLRSLTRQSEARVQVMTLRLGAERAQLMAEVLRLRAAELEGSVNALLDEKESLQQAAQHDPLTGIGNRRYLDDALGRLVANTVERPSFTIIMIDLDHFKQINDDFSHTVGDQVLVRLGSILSQMTRSADIVCRYGGEEFLVVAVGDQLGTGLQVAERIRATVEEHDWEGIVPDLRVTASLGVAEYRGGNVVDTIDRADVALYQAKHDGRNCVRPLPGARGLRLSRLLSSG